MNHVEWLEAALRGKEAELTVTLDALELEGVAREFRAAVEERDRLKLKMAESAEALDGRLVVAGSRGADDYRNVLEAVREYVRAEDALPRDEYDTEDYTLSSAVADLRDRVGGASK